MDPVDLLVAITALLAVPAGVVTAAFWPAVVLIVALVFRAELTAVLRRVESFGAAGSWAKLRAAESAVEVSAQAVEAQESEDDGGGQEGQEQEGSGGEPSGGSEDRQRGPASDVLAASAEAKRRENRRVQLKLIRPAAVLADLEALNEGGIDPILAVLRAEQVATEQINEIARVIAGKHPHSGLPESPAAARRILRDAGVVSSEWMQAWLKLQAARNAIAHRGDRLSASEARSWITLAHRLVWQARRSAIGAVAARGVLEDEEDTERTDD